MDKNFNIFLIENEPDIIKLTQKTLEVGGFKNIDVALTGQEFFNKINSGKKPDIVLLDILLEDKNGIEILKFIKNNVNYRNTKVVVFSAVAEKEKIKEFFAAGADAFILKPFDPYEFLDKINEIIRAM